MFSRSVWFEKDAIDQAGIDAIFVVKMKKENLIARNPVLQLPEKMKKENAVAFDPKGCVFR